jgi:hypothetical protein
MKRTFSLGTFLTILGMALLLLSAMACTGRRQAYPSDLFVPATRRPTPLPPTPDPTERTIPSAVPTPTPVTPCVANLTFLSDLSLPDGTQVQPGEALDKRWQVRNSGDCNWDATYRLKLIAGPALDAATEQALYPARGGSEATLRILFTAPLEAGEYRSAWQAHLPDGQPFGDPIYIAIVVP